MQVDATNVFLNSVKECAPIILEKNSFPLLEFKKPVYNEELTNEIAKLLRNLKLTPAIAQTIQYLMKHDPTKFNFKEDRECAQQPEKSALENRSMRFKCIEIKSNMLTFDNTLQTVKDKLAAKKDVLKILQKRPLWSIIKAYMEGQLTKAQGVLDYMHYGLDQAIKNKKDKTNQPSVSGCLVLILIKAANNEKEEATKTDHADHEEQEENEEDDDFVITLKDWQQNPELDSQEEDFDAIFVDIVGSISEYYKHEITPTHEKIQQLKEAVDYWIEKADTRRDMMPTAIESCIKKNSFIQQIWTEKEELEQQIEILKKQLEQEKKEGAKLQGELHALKSNRRQLQEQHELLEGEKLSCTESMKEKDIVIASLQHVMGKKFKQGEQGEITMKEQADKEKKDERIA
ncbi:unnamed protein product [Prunus armeniaca]